MNYCNIILRRPDIGSLFFLEAIFPRQCVFETRFIASLQFNPVGDNFGFNCPGEKKIYGLPAFFTQIEAVIVNIQIDMLLQIPFIHFRTGAAKRRIRFGVCEYTMLLEWLVLHFRQWVCFFNIIPPREW